MSAPRRRAYFSGACWTPEAAPPFLSSANKRRSLQQALSLRRNNSHYCPLAHLKQKWLRDETQRRLYSFDAATDQQNALIGRLQVTGQDTSRAFERLTLLYRALHEMRAQLGLAPLRLKRGVQPSQRGSENLPAACSAAWDIEQWPPAGVQKMFGTQSYASAREMGR